MAELRIRTVRHTIRVAAPPKRVYQLIANVDRWPRIFDPVLSVEHLGFDGSGERVRFWARNGDRLRSWVSSREVSPKRLQVRFRQERAQGPLASLGGLWLVLPKGEDSLVALDHYYRVVDDDPVEAARLEKTITTTSTAMLAAVRRAAELDEVWHSLPDTVHVDDNVEGVSSK
ncbi:aromatase/cyclase [Actinophytocola sp.]|uniref:aromatase/cyclase n=1 Tax=Actinophytocola sp. TaxID=1872138 RepID=UPI002ED948F8